MASWARKGETSNQQGSLIFHLHEGVGSLTDALAIIAGQKLSLSFIESRRSQTPGWDYDFLVTFRNVTKEQLTGLADALQKSGKAAVSFSTASLSTIYISNIVFKIHFGLLLWSERFASFTNEHSLLEPQLHRSL